MWKWPLLETIPSSTVYILHLTSSRAAPYLYYYSLTLCVSPQFPWGLYEGRHERTHRWLADGDDRQRSGVGSPSEVCETDVNICGWFQSVRVPLVPGILCDPLTDGRAKDGGSLPDQKLCQILKWVPAESETNYSGATHFFKQGWADFYCCNSSKGRRENVNAMSKERAKTLA